jgi:3-methylcrotonyl-CoA carboxylase alpha subunit
MGQAAVRAAEAIGYSGAGTVEFIVDASQGLRPDRFWFMEMNTRLQVEHPVTEAITGVDLVEWQLRVASGEPLPARQEDLRISGHAFEARLYAEDVAAGFLPATGTLTHLAFAPGARVDTGVRAGDTISPWYDPMIAKLTVHGPTRAVALAQLTRALEATEVAGSVTNLGFLAALSRHPGFRAGDVDTGLIGRDLQTLTDALPPSGAIVALAAIAAAGLAEGAGVMGGFTLWAPLRRAVLLEGHMTTLSVEAPDRVRVEIDGAVHDCVLKSDGWWVDGAKTGAHVVTHAGGISVFAQGAHHFNAVDPLARVAEVSGGGGLTLAPMPGLVKAVFVVPGQEVAAGERLAVLEAMKMEHTLLAGRAGVVAEVLCAPGVQVEAGAALIRLEVEP